MVSRVCRENPDPKGHQNWKTKIVENWQILWTVVRAAYGLDTRRVDLVTPSDFAYSLLDCAPSCRP
jgi:hypothetical protein